jgi:homoserine kinase type II
MAVYTQLKKSDLKKLLASFDIKKFTWKTISGGSTNSNYLIRTDKGRFVLTLFEEKTMEEVRQLADLLEWFRERDFPTSQPVLSNSGDQVLRYNKSPVMLKSWVPGKVVSSLNKKQLFQAGLQMARLHQLEAPDMLPENQYYNSSVLDTVIGKGPDAKYEKWLQKQHERLKEILPQELPQGIVHGDLFFDNILFQKGNLQAIIDFEQACYERYLYDVGMALVALCTKNSSLSPRKTKAFLKGYEEIQRLSGKERKHLPAFVEYAATATSRWRYWKYNIQTPTPRRKNTHKKMVQLVKEVQLIHSIGW